MNKSDLQAPPKNFELLESLTEVQFKLNSFKDWPSQLNKMSLQKLDLSFNRLNKIPPTTNGFVGWLGFEKVQHLQTSLKELNLGYNYFTSFPVKLLEFTALEKLILTKNDLDTLPDLGRLGDTLKEFAVEECKFTTFPVAICSLMNLRILNVNGNKFKWFPQTQGVMNQLFNLIEIYANGCDLQGWSQLFSQAKLQILHLSNNAIRGIPTEVRTLQMVEELILSKNLITHIPEHFGDFINLVYLDMSDNNIEDIDPAFANLKQLEVLKMKNNRIVELPEGMSELERLTEIDLSENDLKSLFDFSKLTMLEKLEVTYNYLEVFPNVGNCKKLTYLDLTMNRISGPIPADLYQLSALKFCKLKHNAFESIGPDIKLLESLDTFIIDNNEVLEIPDTVMELKNLKTFSALNNYKLEPSQELKEYMDKNNIVFTYEYEEPTKIRDFLFLSSAPPAGSRRLLKSLGVTHILTIAKDIPPKYSGDFKYMVIYADDSTDSTLLPHLEEAAQFIDEAVQKGEACMVHCMAGVSRSSTIVISYLMQAEKKRLKNAYLEVKELRPQIKPNDRFYNELKVFDKKLYANFTPTQSLPKNRVEYFDETTDERVFKRPKEKPSVLNSPTTGTALQEVYQINSKNGGLFSIFNFASNSESSESPRIPVGTSNTSPSPTTNGTSSTE